MREFYSVKEFAASCGISKLTAYRMLWAGKLPARKFGSVWRIPASALSLDPKEGARHE
ncbi:MAG: helix-turn-helix domain-containing protein [Candidatus Hydrogenedentes bacterium]|nr:helix-turn-helix domain-containing protein [Candidatus Hydrogenedentota bacterium]